MIDIILLIIDSSVISTYTYFKLSKTQKEKTVKSLTKNYETLFDLKFFLYYHRKQQ